MDEPPNGIIPPSERLAIDDVTHEILTGDDQRDYAEEQANADLLATGDGEANVTRVSQGILIGNALDDHGQSVIIDRVRGIVHIGVRSNNGNIEWGDIDLDDLHTALRMLNIDC